MDLNHSVGEECKEELAKEFGKENCIFIQCDVTQRDNLQGKVLVRTLLRGILRFINSMKLALGNGILNWLSAVSQCNHALPMQQNAQVSPK